MTMNKNRYPVQLYPRSQEHLDEILADYYTLTIEIETLQKHILKIQIQKQNEYRYFNDQRQKLKLYIDQIQNEIKKRQQRQLSLIDRLKQLQNSRFQQIEELKFSKNSQHQQITYSRIQSQYKYKLQQIQQLQNSLRQKQMILKQQQIFFRQKQNKWKSQKVNIIKQSQTLMIQNIQIANQLNQMKKQIKQRQILMQIISEKLFIKQKQTAQFNSILAQLNSELKNSQTTVNKLKTQNNELENRIDQLETKIRQKQLIPTISSSCPNCLKFNKLHENELEKKNLQIQHLKKDIQCLLAFFQTPQ